jgi:transposase
VLLPRQQAKLARGAKDKEHAMSQTPNTAIAVIGIDIGKNSFHVVGHDARGAIVLRQKWSRGQVEARLANIPPCLIGMEARRRRTSPEPQTRIAWSRCQVDAGQICPPL